MPKLTLSVDGVIVSRAKRYASARGTSLSKMVSAYLAEVAKTDPKAPDADPPVLESLRGILKKGSVEDYKAHLVGKHR